MTIVAFLDGYPLIAYDVTVEKEDVSVRNSRVGAAPKDRTYYEICLDVSETESKIETTSKLSHVLIHDEERLVELRATPLHTANGELCFESTENNVRVIE